MTETLTMPTATPARDGRRPRGVRRVLLESGYAPVGVPDRLVAFVVVVIDLSLGVALRSSSAASC